jgi:hypothetical protein
MKLMVSLVRTFILLAPLAAPLGASHAEEFRVEEVPSATRVVPGQLKGRIIAFSDYREDKVTDPGTGLVSFEDWARARPVEKQFLSPFPGYKEPTIQVTVHGLTKPYTEKLHVYVVEARFQIAKPPGSIDLARYARLEMLEKIDPSIKHRLITADQAKPNVDPGSAHNRHPNRRWCEVPQSLCIESRYHLEGKLPAGVRLANKLEEDGKKISEYMEFQSEMRVLPPEETDQAGLGQLTGLAAPIMGVLEQTLFDVNQVMQFGKLLAVLQESPSDKTKTIATVFMAFAVETDVLERKREFENVPVLRNLIPAQVLMGKSSFNAGNSISAGLPEYTRNRIRAIADLLEK